MPIYQPRLLPFCSFDYRTDQQLETGNPAKTPGELRPVNRMVLIINAGGRKDHVYKLYRIV